MRHQPTETERSLLGGSGWKVLHIKDGEIKGVFSQMEEMPYKPEYDLRQATLAALQAAEQFIADAEAKGGYAALAMYSEGSLFFEDLGKIAERFETELEGAY